MTKPIIDMPSQEELSEFTSQPYSKEEIDLVPDLEDKIEKLMEFFGQSGIQYDKALNSDKTAYPNYDYMAIPGQRDTQKWLQTVRDIYAKETNGVPRVQAIRQATSGWNVVETFDFLNWLRFYEEGAHLKYKTAQLWYESSAPGYYLPVKQEKPVSGHDIDHARDTIEEDAERKRTIEKQRQKLLGRLNSAEKLLCSPEGQMFAGKELETLMEAIYTLKKKIQLINKKSTSTRLYEDMIIREANILSKNGFVKASETLHALAQDMLPAPAPPEEPEKGSGSAGGLPSMGPGMPQNPPESAPNDMSVIPKQSPGMAGFLEGLETSKLTAPDELEVEDPSEVLEVADADDELMVEAQELPPQLPMEAPPVAEEAPMEVMEDEVPVEPEKAKDFDNMIDAAFSNLTIEDVVNKLEDLAKIFKTREIPRQLAIVDMMLDSLGLASFFPSLSEASNRAIESNNYIATRLEDIISKLRGTMETRDIDLKKEDQQVSPEMAAFKQNLQEQEDQEKTRKQTRKGLVGEPPPEVPQVEIGEDLGKAAPVLTPAPAVAPVAPIAPPPAV